MATATDIRKAIRVYESRGEEDKAKRLRSALFRKQLENIPAYTPPSDAGLLENIGKGLVGGAVGMLESSALGAATLLEEESELKARDKIKRVADSLTPEGADEESIAYKLSAGLGSIGALLPTAFLGGAALPVAGTIAAGAGAGEASERARAFGATEDERSSAAFRGTLIGATEVLPLGRLFKAFEIKELKNVLGKLEQEDIKGITSRVRRAAGTGLVEGAQEGAAAILQNLNERGYNAERELVDSGVLEEALIGGGAGAILQGLVDVLVKGKARGVEKEEVPEDDAEDTETTDEVVETTEETVETVKTKDGTEVAAKESNRKEFTDEEASVEIAAANARLKAESEKRANLKEQYNKKIAATGVDVTEYAGLTDKQKNNLEEAAGVTDAEREAINKRVDDEIDKVAKAMAGVDMDAIIAEQTAETGTKLDTAETTELDTAETTELDTAETTELDTAETVAPKKITYTRTKPEGEEIANNDDKQALTNLLSNEQNINLNKEAKKFFAIHERFDDAVETIAYNAANPKTVTETRRDYTDLRVTEKRLKATPFKNKTYTLEEYNELGSNTNAKKGLRKAIAEKFQPDIIRSMESTDKVMPFYESALTWAQTNLSEDVNSFIQTKIEAAKEQAKKVEESGARADVLIGGRRTPAQMASLVEGLKKTANTSLTKEQMEDVNAKLKKATDTTKQIRILENAIKDPTAIRRVLDEVDTVEGEVDTAEEVDTVEGEVDTTEEVDTITDTDPQVRAQARAERFEATQSNNFEKAINRNIDVSSQVRDESGNLVLSPKAQTNIRKLEEYVANSGVDKKRNQEKLKTYLQSKIPIEIKKREKKKKLTPLQEAFVAASEKFKVSLTDVGAAVYLEDSAPDKIAALKKIKTKKEFTALVVEGRRAYENQKALNVNDRKEGFVYDTLLSNTQSELLQNNNIQGLLQDISRNASNNALRRIARVLTKFSANTTIEFSDMPVAGRYIPAEDKIIINPDLNTGGPTIETVLHEVTHAVTVGNLKNKSHPATKQLMNLYKQVKERTDSTIGMESLEEFVAEAFSNPRFQQLLSNIELKEPANALQKFFTVVGNFVRRLLGMDVKQPQTAAKEIDQAIYAVLSADRDLRNIEIYNSTSDPKDVNIALQKVIDKQKETEKEITPASVQRAIKTVFIDAPSTRLKQVAVKLISSQGMGDVAKATGFKNLGDRQHILIEELAGASFKADQEVQKVVDEVVKWSSKNPQGKAALDTLIYDPEFGATIYNVNPFLTKAEADKKYGNKKDEMTGEALIDIWNLQQPYVKIANRTGARKIYDLMKKLYRDQLLQTKRVIEDRRKQIFEDPESEEAKRVKNVFEKIFDRSTLEEYFPLVRGGQFKVLYNVKNAKSEKDNFVLKMFETKAERDEYAKAVKANDEFENVVVTNEAVNTEFFEKAPPTSFVGEVLRALQKSGADKDVQDDVMNLFIDTLPETSLAKSMRTRKKTPGYIEDSLIALRSRAFDSGRNLVKLEYNEKLLGIETQIQERVKELQNNPPEGVESSIFKPSIETVANELMLRNGFARGRRQFPQGDKAAQYLNQTAFIYTLGLNLSSSLVNLTQVPMFASAMLIPKYGGKETMTELGKAYNTVAQLGAFNSTPFSIEKFFDVKTNVDNDGVKTETITLKKGAPKQLAEVLPLLKVARDRGQLYQTNIADALGLDESGRLSRQGFFSNALNRSAAFSAVAFNAGERLSRQVSLISTYNLELQRVAKENKVDVKDLTADQKTKAANEALYMTQELNGGARLETGARISQEHLGRIAFMYKNFGLQMYYTMIKSWKNIFKSASPQEQKLAAQQFIAVHGVAALFAGVQGVPIYGVLQFLWDTFVTEEGEEDFDTMVRKAVNEGFYKGPLVEATGLDVADRVKLNGLLFQENRFKSSFADYEFIEFLGFHFGGPALSVIERLRRGVVGFSEAETNREYLRATEDLLPPFASNFLKSYRYSEEEGKLTRRGDPIVTDLTTGDHIGIAVGFSPKEMTFNQELSNLENKIGKVVSNRRKQLLKRLHVTRRLGDMEGYRETFKEVREFNKKYGSKDPKARITVDTIKRSLRSAQETSINMHNGVTVPAYYKRELERARKEYTQGFGIFED